MKVRPHFLILQLSHTNYSTQSGNCPYCNEASCCYQSDTGQSSAIKADEYTTAGDVNIKICGKTNKVFIVDALEKLPDLKQLFFDCDNTLAHTETLAFDVTDILVNELLARHDIEKRYVQTELLGDFLGLTFKQMMPKLAAKHGFVLKDETFDLMRAREEEEIIKIVQEKGKACKGCVQVLEKLADAKKYSMAVVSSSSSKRITGTLAATDQLRFFKAEDIYSAVDSLPEPKGKPSPEVYKHVLKKLGYEPFECLTVEDSRIGAAASLGAGVPTIGYLGCYNSTEVQKQLATDFIKMGCEAIMYHWDEYLGILEELTSPKEE
jgi:HAD superfamily hydrolase (TIGR01509 family)